MRRRDRLRALIGLLLCCCGRHRWQPIAGTVGAQGCTRCPAQRVAPAGGDA